MTARSLVTTFNIFLSIHPVDVPVLQFLRADILSMFSCLLVWSTVAVIGGRGRGRGLVVVELEPRVWTGGRQPSAAVVNGRQQGVAKI